MQETDISKCKVCGKLEVRRFKGTFDGKNKKFVDAEDRLWNGRTCGNCHKNKVKAQTKERRSNAKSSDDNEDRAIR